MKYHVRLEYDFLQIIYGNNVTDPVDQNCLSAMVDYWISTNSTRKEFEMPKRKDSFTWNEREYLFMKFIVDNCRFYVWKKNRNY